MRMKIRFKECNETNYVIWFGVLGRWQENKAKNKCSKVKDADTARTSVSSYHYIHETDACDCFLSHPTGCGLPQVYTDHPPALGTCACFCRLDLITSDDVTTAFIGSAIASVCSPGLYLNIVFDADTSHAASQFFIFNPLHYIQF